MFKIGYLVDENGGWDDEPSWKFYEENELPSFETKYKRIVYSEIEND